MSTEPHAAHARTHQERFAQPKYQAALSALMGKSVAITKDACRRSAVPDAHWSVTSRVKAARSFETKASRSSDDDPTKPRYPDPCEHIGDQVGIRIVTWLPGELEAIAEALRADTSRLKVHEEVDKRHALERDRAFGYSGIHLGIELRAAADPPTLPSGFDRLPRVEVQLRTRLQHAWSEQEHALRYKPGSGPIDAQSSRTLDRVAALLETADDLLQTVAEDAPHAGRDEGALSVETLRPLLAELFPSALASRRIDSVPWILRHLTALDCATAADVRDLVQQVDLDKVDAAFATLNHRERSQVRRLDDALLAGKQERYIDVVRTSGVTAPEDVSSRTGILAWRLEKLRELSAVPPAAG